MRLRNIRGAREAVEASGYCVRDPHGQKGQWRALFPRCERLYLEIGCGKGRFLRETALRHPESGFIGIERYASVLYKAVSRMPEHAPDNIRFAMMDATLLAEVFAAQEADGIFLNFSDPWPKERHRERRLVSTSFLRRYDRVLAPDGEIAFKTDNAALFDFCLEQAPLAGFIVRAMTYDLHADPVMGEGNVMTEYEQRFSREGHPIMKCIMTRA